MEIPSGAAMPQDHMKPAAQREAEEPTEVTVEWRGQSFTIPASLDDCDLDTLEAFENGKAVAAVRGILGDRAFSSFKRKNKPNVRDFNEFAKVVALAMGMDPGE